MSHPVTPAILRKYFIGHAALAVVLDAGMITALWPIALRGWLILTVVACLASVTIFLFRWQPLVRRLQTYEWYRSAYPKCVQGRRLTCRHCSADRIFARSLMNHTYTREHFCAQCGTTLYYSPEG